MIVYISQIGKNMQFWIKNKYLQIFKLSYPLKLIDAINLNRHLLELCLKKSITHDVMSNFNGKKTRIKCTVNWNDIISPIHV